MQLASQLWGWAGPQQVTLKPLAAGKNFLSDAYFATIQGSEGKRKIFVKVSPYSALS